MQFEGSLITYSMCIHKDLIRTCMYSILCSSLEKKNLKKISDDDNFVPLYLHNDHYLFHSYSK